MTVNNTVLGLVGSPNRAGRTFQVVSATLEAAAAAGAQVELVQMADHVVAPCKDCATWPCRETQLCRYADEGFALLSDKLVNCGALVLGTPVYWWDTSAMVKYFILKMFRVHARSGPLAGLPALGIGVAGGTGNGLVSGLRPIYHFFQMQQMRALSPLPVTRFSWDGALKEAGKLGAELARLAGDERWPFSSLEERLLFYDDLPYINLSRSGERRLLAALAAGSLPEGRVHQLAHLLTRAEELWAGGDAVRSLETTTEVYDASVKAFEEDRA